MASTDLQTEYVGRRLRLFGLAVWTSLLTVLTLGFYRFWMKTRLRRYYWSAIRPGGQPLEYVGEPLEKLLGFLIAVVFLSFYIGIVNLILMFLSFSFLNNNFMAYAVSLVGIVPFYFYARYRARRYILARSRWRGLRFGMDPGAWGYAWRALLHWAVTLLSLGALWPRMTFLLEKYRTDRTVFGTQHFQQNGHWKMLYRPFLPFVFGAVTTCIGVVIATQGESFLAASAIALGVVIAIYGLVHYRVNSFRVLTNHKSLGDAALHSAPRTLRVLWVYGFGFFLVVVVLGLALTALVVALGFILAAAGLVAGLSDLETVAQSIPIWLTSVVAATLYFSVFILGGALTHAFITLPLARHYAETLEIRHPASINDIRQIDRDEFVEAEGFAEALDVGAAL